jgi:hypothetical protein
MHEIFARRQYRTVKTADLPVSAHISCGLRDDGKMSYVTDTGKRFSAESERVDRVQVFEER